MSTNKSNKHQIFLASSAELVDDRREFEIFINRQNKRWHERGLFLELVIWEDFIDAMSPTQLQDEYNKAIQQCDLFVMLFWTKVGMYTAEEFEKAFQQFKATGRPLVYTYFKTAPVNITAANLRDMTSLVGFQDKLKALGHFQTEYENKDALCRKFGEQLAKLALQGFFGHQPGPETPASLAAAAGTSYNATLHGGGAIAQGLGAVAVGAGGVSIGASTSTIQTDGGAYVGGNVSVTNGSFTGRDRNVSSDRS